MPKCLVGNVTIHYEIRGKGKPLLMIHGFAPDHRLMSGCMEPVFEEIDGYKRIYFDLPGMGQTENYKAVKNSDDMLDVVLGFIDKLIPDERFLIAGESYGGYLTRGIISKLRDRVQGAFFICPVIIPDRQLRTLPEHRILSTDLQLLESLTAEEQSDFRDNFVVLDEVNWQRYNREVVIGLKQADEAALLQIGSGYGFSFDPDKEVFEEPCLFLTGRQDDVVGYQDAWKLIEKYPRASFAVLDMAGHNLQIEQPAIFNAFVKDWLHRIND